MDNSKPHDPETMDYVNQNELCENEQFSQIILNGASLMKAFLGIMNWKLGKVLLVSRNSRIIRHVIRRFAWFPLSFSFHQQHKRIFTLSMNQTRLRLW